MFAVKLEICETKTFWLLRVLKSARSGQIGILPTMPAAFVYIGILL